MTENELTENPFDLFEQWLGDAMARDGESIAMALSSIDDDGMPDTRMVLMRGIERTNGREAIVFYTNYESRKGRSLLANPRCAALFYWGRLDGYADADAEAFGARQVRLVGRAEKVESELSDTYFAQRPRLSQLGAWASPQSQPISGREVLERRIAELEVRFLGHEVTRPPHWGGFRILVERIEFWRAQVGRLHDRFEYRRDEEHWVATRLAP